MKIVIDLQGAQSESRFRGIGRYSLSLALNIAKLANEYEIWIVLNGSLQESIPDIRKSFEGIVLPERIKVFEVPFPVAEINANNSVEPRIAELFREYFINQINPDIVLVTSLFEGFVDDATVSIGFLYEGIETAVILYDLIPYHNKEKYLPTAIQKDHYQRKIDSLKRAGLLLAISESSKEEARKALKINTIENISTAVDGSFKKLNLTKDQVSCLLNKYKISRSIIMYAPGGFDYRKNFDGLIFAFGQLPADIRSKHQLVIASKLNKDNQNHLIELAQQAGLNDDEMVLTGYVSNEDLIQLYTICQLFVFPSKHEGFGLPVLEAMSCGAVVIGSNTTSIPEVIGWSEAQFDPHSISSLADKMQQALSDEKFRAEFKQRSKKHIAQFSWTNTATKALTAIKTYLESKTSKKIMSFKPKLAYFSPLPPVKSGISDYSIELLTELSLLYNIILITDQQEVDSTNIHNSIAIESVPWFLKHVDEFDRILYQIGNSPYHSYMRPVFKKYPGVMVLHDFYMSGMLAYDELIENKTNVWKKALFRSHGYGALKEFYTDSENAKNTYPCNLSFIENSIGLITHSEYSKKLIKKWYGTSANAVTETIPLLRKSKASINKSKARTLLNINSDDFIVCSFGFLDATKLNDKLIESWLASELHHQEKCKLIFVGENQGAEYGQSIVKSINEHAINSNISITGWTDNETFKLYLEAADVGVQLRKDSRGETSAAVLDCMNYENATIINANGSMANIPKQSVLMLADFFESKDLTLALERLYRNKKLRALLAKNAKETIVSQHDPRTCAEKYSQAIEKSYASIGNNQLSLINELAKLIKKSSPNQELLPIANTVFQLTFPIIRQKQILVDVSTIVQNDLKTGIERVVRAQLLELMKSCPKGYRIEAVYYKNNSFHYARKYTAEILGVDFADESSVIEIAGGDIFYGLDFSPYTIVESAKHKIFERFITHGVSINFVVYDLLPVLNPEFFPEGADEPHRQWLKIICKYSDKLICISNAVADELSNWIADNKIQCHSALTVTFLHLGGDIDASKPSTGISDKQNEIFNHLTKKPTFLMVGTIEPRKGHLQTLEVFGKLWEINNINLVIIGHEGWKSLANEARRTIPTIVEKIRNHPLLDRNLFWLQDVSDECLEKIYQHSSCLIAASESEGFGLPLIEAARFNLPIVARNIPVFKEVAESNAEYFKSDGSDFQEVVSHWLANDKNNKSSSKLNWTTWNENVSKLVDILLPAD